MDTFKGTIVAQTKADRGFWYTIFSNEGTHRFFSRKEIFSLFENCEVVLEKKNNCFFVSDYSTLDETPPLKSRPDNIIAAFWLSRLADSLTFSDSAEFDFIEKCRNAVATDFNKVALDTIENHYIQVSGYNSSDEPEKIIHDCFFSSIKLRRSLINQISLRK
ncbi:MAG TPA: hypothetical protein PLD55_06795 [bacterium]|jgi:hypothetical protein|nr:hypothetical protein [bacterium]MDX9805291.1 hypothetical protein [bacterium]HNW16389.1 hypothetical protein [bacterium]HOG42685.1 hypothetical protein [bacterium]HPG36535.1 hypothetical protein [bacterium]